MTNSMGTLKYGRALELLNLAVLEKGADYTYQAEIAEHCKYFEDDGTPSCLVGYVFAYIGAVDKDALGAFNTGTGIANLSQHLPFKIEPEALELLVNVQAFQDSGVAWGDAVAQAAECSEAQRDELQSA